MRTHATNAPTARGQLPEQGYVRLDQFVPSLIPVSRATFHRWQKEGAVEGLPRPIKFGGRAVFYSVSDVRAFLESRGAEPVTQ
ncbi:helix-turn-helix transcriptional regulator [Burkholderia ubonensis]|uniref:helix-turn-helix transcriptional regulator n=1 Tax=Burkholderia ubonensis TaxID=101571 RepID=UPI000755FF62|nr:hypothetical protein [Burkholderia ubonensis]KVZ52983.1 hypothetical protein WL16_14715 [Burkholderia ubonensis]